MPLTELTGSPELLEVHRQASRYFNAVHGPDWVFKAPEQWANLVERWIWALAAGDLVFADESAIAAAFTEWDRRYREEPERFQSEAVRLLKGTPESYGEAAAPYLVALLEGRI